MDGALADCSRHTSMAGDASRIITRVGVTRVGVDTFDWRVCIAESFSHLHACYR